MRKSQQLFIVMFFCFAFGAQASVLLPFEKTQPPEQLYEDALDGDAKAQFELASFYAGLRKVDYPNVVLWLRRSAAQDYLEAQFALGRIYHYGKPSVAVDLIEAEKWYEKAAAKGDKQALKALDDLRAQAAYKIESYPDIDDKWDAQWTAKTAQQGDMQSQFDLARLYAEGKKIQMDYQQAAIWYEKAAVQGHIEAMYALAMLYFEGKGLNADVNKALFWFEQAALRDYIPAQQKLYEIYSEGVERVPDLVKAAGWLYVSLAYLFPEEKDLTSVSPELEKIWSELKSEQKEQVLYFAYSFIDERRVRR